MWCSLSLKAILYLKSLVYRKFFIILLRLLHSLCWALHKSQENKRKHLRGCFLLTSFSHLICLLLIAQADSHPNPHTHSQTWWLSHHHRHYYWWTLYSDRKAVPSLKMQMCFFCRSFCRRRRRRRTFEIAQYGPLRHCFVQAKWPTLARFVCINKRHQAVESPSYVHRSSAN